MKNDYLIQKKPLNALLLFCLPMIIGNLFQQLYTMVDSAVVGRVVGEQALAAVGASYSLTNVFICVAIGGGMGASVVFSRYFGQGNMARMKTAMNTAMLAFLGISAVLAGIGLLFSRQIMSILNTPADVLDMAAEYLNIYFVGLPFLFMFNILSCMFNAVGKSRIPLYFLVFSSVLNIALDIYMVAGLHMGVAGVAWATVIAQGVSVLLSYAMYRRMLHGLYNGRAERFNMSELSMMTHIALPSIFQQSTVSIGMMLVQSVVNSFGSEMLAGFSAAMRVESLCIMPMAAISSALSFYTAQNLGAGKPERVVSGHRAAVGLAFAFGFLICVVLECFNGPIVGIFLGDDSTYAAMSTGRNYLSFMGWFFWVIGIKMAADGVLRGAGDMRMFMIANMANLSLRVIVAVTLAPRMGIHMVWIAVPIGWLVNWIVSFCEYRTGKWRTSFPKKADR